MNKNLARILLLFVFMARGCSFLFSKILLQTVSPMSIRGIAAAGESLSVLKLIGYALILTALLLYHRNGRRA